jgi:hypothetical protein
VSAYGPPPEPDEGEQAITAALPLVGNASDAQPVTAEGKRGDILFFPCSYYKAKCIILIPSFVICHLFFNRLNMSNKYGKELGPSGVSGGTGLYRNIALPYSRHGPSSHPHLLIIN